jgi:hypothetical protein
MPAEFRYLVNKDRRGDGLSVEGQFKREALVARPVIRDEFHNRFLVFEGRGEALAWCEAQPEAEKCFHEVVFGFLPQRIKFDVDAPAHKLDALPEATLRAAVRAAEGSPREDAGAEADDLGAYLDEILDARPDTPVPEDPFAVLGLDAPETPPPSPDTAEEGRAAKARVIVGLLIEAILDEFYVAYYGVEDILPARDDLAVTDSSGPTASGWKYSYHVLALPYAVVDNEEAKEFTARVLARLPEPVRAFVDPDVNKRIQNFRLAGSAKPGTGRYKRATPEAAEAFGTARGVSAADLFVTALPGSRVLARVYTEPAPGDRARKGERAPVALQGPAVKAALDLAAAHGVTVGHAYSETRGSLLCFTREEPSHCRICGETHHRDNSLMLSLEPADAGHDGPWPGTGAVTCRLVEHCRQARGRGRTVGELQVRAEDLRGLGGRAPRAKAPPAAGLGLGELVAARVAAIGAGRANPHEALASEFERLPEAQKTVYAEPTMRDYELVPTLAVLAQMKLGKTKAMRRFLDAHFAADGLAPPVVRFVTFRQTFSRSLAESFPDFALYSDVVGDLDAVRHPRLIVQAESLHRLKMTARPEPVDLLVLDEAESILAQFNSGLHRHFNAAFAMFQWMLRTARHVVVMDANLGDRTFRTLARMRPAHPPHFHWNRFARAADDAYFFTADQGAWLGELYAQVRAGRRVVVPTNSLEEARAFEQGIRAQFPARRVMLYSSETPPTEKARHFADVHTYWTQFDVLIYTPTCSAGVSFELEHFDALFGYFCDASCDVETCRQMLGRVRNLRTREHYICLRATGAALPTAVDDIRRAVYDKRTALFRSIEDTALQWSYADDPDGGIRYYESDYFHLWLETVRVGNLSRNDFARRFIDQVADTGARVATLAPRPELDGAALLLDHRAARADLKAARAEAVAGAEDLSPDEAAGVREALSAQRDVEPARRLAYDKYLLRDAYAWHDRPLDADFVLAYQGRDARRVYRNLCRITEGRSVLESLKAMREREAGHYAYVMETRTEAAGFVNESRDLLRDKSTYVFQAHFIAVWFLCLCGLSSVVDKARVHEAELEARLRGAIPALRKALDRIVFEFEIRRPNLDRLARELDRARFLSGMLGLVNGVLRATYGVQVQRVAKRAGGGAYFLNQSPVGRLFVFSREPEPDDTPKGPRPHIPSNLEPVGRGDERVNLFLADAYYGGLEAAGGGAPTGLAPAGQDDLADFLAEAFEAYSARPLGE